MCIVGKKGHLKQRFWAGEHSFGMWWSLSARRALRSCPHMEEFLPKKKVLEKAGGVKPEQLLNENWRVLQAMWGTC